MPDSTSFQLRFSKEGMDHIVQNRRGSDLDDLVRVWPNTSIWKQSGVQESSGLISGRTQTGPLPVSNF